MPPVAITAIPARFAIVTVAPTVVPPFKPPAAIEQISLAEHLNVLVSGFDSLWICSSFIPTWISPSIIPIVAGVTFCFLIISSILIAVLKLSGYGIP
ncbi:GSCOCG00007556001-RA-CDS [Cotesia congregata]|nr:GSCOCG00007556001-RA-CDS [Cotesia congregata]